MYQVYEIVFLSCLFLILYAYFFYPVLVFIAYSLAQIRRDLQYLNLRQERRISGPSTEGLPYVSVVIPAYNEEDSLPGKLINLRQLDYPPEKLELILVSDGSTDRTNDILLDLDGPGIKKIILPSREGKATALNRAAELARGDVLVFSDAGTLMTPDVILKLIRHFSDPRVGVVCGSLQFEGTAESVQTEGIYWRYECILRLMEARLGATLTASGAVYAMRRQCFRPIPADTLIDDFVVPMTARRLGYRVLYDPEAIAMDSAASTVAGEFTRRVRLAVGSFRALPELLHVPMKGFMPVAFFSHKLLRWILPFLLIGLLISNSFLLGERVYQVLFIAQLAFYAWGLLGVLLRKRLRKVRFALVGYFVLAMNLAFLVGFFQFLSNRKETTWQRVH